MTTNSIIIEGLDRLGKSSLIDGLKNKLGFFQTIHYAKPEKLQVYEWMSQLDRDPPHPSAAKMYQEDSFRTMFKMLASQANLILDRAHLGECVYAPMYRGYDGNYVFDLEDEFGAIFMSHVKLILLTEDFSISKHFVDDGESLGTPDKRKAEQELFIEAFNKSQFQNKKIISVTDPITGQFKSKEDVLAEALA